MPKKTSSPKVPRKKVASAKTDKAVVKAAKKGVAEYESLEALTAASLAEQKELNRLTKEIIRPLWVNARATIAVAIFTGLVAFFAFFDNVVSWWQNL